MKRRARRLWVVSFLACAGCDDEVASSDAGALADAAAVITDGAVVTPAVDASPLVDAAPVDDTQADASPPPFRFWVEPSRVVLVPGTCLGIKAKIERLRYDGQIFIGVGGTLPSVGVATTHVPPGASEGDITLITPTRAEPVTGGQLLLAATNDQHRERQLLYMPVDILPRAAGDAGAPDGGFNQSTLEDSVCRSLANPPPP